MSFYPVKIPWTAKPPIGTPLRSGHWSTQGIIGAWAFNEYAGKSFYGVGGTLTASAGSWHSDGYQTDGTAVGGGPQLTNASGASAYNFEGDFTVFVDYICLDPAEDNNCIIGKGNTTTPFPFMVLGQYATNRFSILRTGSTGTAVNAVISGVGTARDVTRIAMGKRGGDLFLHAYNKAANYYNTVTDTTTGSHANIAPLTLGNRDNGYFQSKNIYKLVLIYNRALSVAELESLCDNPLQIYQPRTVWVPVAASGGGTSYTETLTALAENYAAVTDIATYIDAAEAIITAGATADATVQMLEGVLSAAVVAASVTDTAVVVDTVQTGATAEVTVHDTAQMVENAATAVAAEASVTDAIVSGVAENLLASATSLASATDVQLMVDNLTIMAASGASISEIYTYLEQLTAAATSGASVTDVLVTQFVGRYLFVVTVPPREFITTVSPRSYLTTVGPR